MRKIISLSLAASFALTVHAQISITKDLSFGNNGTVTINTGTTPMFSYILLIPNINSTFQGNKIFLGYPYSDASDPTLKSQFVRLNSDGSFDNTFGSGGVIKLTDFEPYYFYANSSYFYLNGNIKYLTGSGQPDPNFISTGIQNVTDWIYKTVLDDGKIFVRAESSFNKFLPDGSVDFTYGANGSITLSSPVAGDPNDTYDFFFNRNNFIFEFISSNSGPLNVRKIDLTTGNLDITYGNNGYAQVKNSSVPSSAGFAKSIVSTQNDGSFVNKLSDGNTVYFTKTNPLGIMDTTFGNNGVISGPMSFTSNGITYSGGSMDPLMYNNLIIMPASSTDPQGNTVWGVSGYSLNGAAMNINGNAFFPLSGISYESLGYIFAKDNYLYAIHDNNITRYTVQQSSSTLGIVGDQKSNGFTVSVSNPFREELSVMSDQKIRKVEIKDQAGRTVLVGNQNKLDTSFLTEGVYTIIITEDSGKERIVKGIKK